jgi:hypothetical protein
MVIRRNQGKVTDFDKKGELIAAAKDVDFKRLCFFTRPSIPTAVL